MYVAWRWDFTFEILPKMLLATLNTFMAAGLGYAIAAVVGLLFMLGQRTPYKFVNVPTREIVEFIRSTPLLVQLFFVYFVAPQFGAIFFMITGFHGTHVTIGVIFLFIMARKAWRGDFDTGRRGFFTSQKSNYEAIEIMGLYWHFVDLVWVFIFAFFYLW